MIASVKTIFVGIFDHAQSCPVFAVVHMRTGRRTQNQNQLPMKFHPVVMIYLISLLTAMSFFVSAQTPQSHKRLRNASLDDAQELFLKNFPSVYSNGPGIDAEDWEQTFRIDEQKEIIEYKRRPFVKNNTSDQWFATIVIPLASIVAFHDNHDENTITIEALPGEVVSYQQDNYAAKSSTLTIQMRDLGGVRYLAERVFKRIQYYVQQKANVKDK